MSVIQRRKATNGRFDKGQGIMYGYWTLFDPGIGVRHAGLPAVGVADWGIGAFWRCVVGGSTIRASPASRDSDRGCDRHAAICTAALPAV